MSVAMPSKPSSARMCSGRSARMASRSGAGDQRRAGDGQCAGDPSGYRGAGGREDCGSPQLYEELCQQNPAKAHEILSDGERRYVVTLHNGWRGFLHPFLLPADYAQRVFGIDEFSRSGRPSEIYADAGFDPAGLRRNSSST